MKQSLRLPGTLRKRTWAVLLLLPVVFAFAALCIGRMMISPADILRSVAAHITGGETVKNVEIVLWKIRLPRILLALLVGGGLSAAVDAYSKKIFDDVQSRTASITDENRERIFFLFQYSEANITTSGAHFFGQYWADTIGAENVGAELANDKSAAVNIEQVYAWNPSKILITNYTTAQPDDLLNNTIGAYDWSGVDAIANSEVYKMPLGMYRSYTCGVDTPLTLYRLGKAVYPALFSDIDMREETKRYYSEVFGITLTDAQAESIFKPVSAGSAY